MTTLRSFFLENRAFKISFTVIFPIGHRLSIYNQQRWRAEPPHVTHPWCHIMHGVLTLISKPYMIMMLIVSGETFWETKQSQWWVRANRSRQICARAPDVKELRMAVVTHICHYFRRSIVFNGVICFKSYVAKLWRLKF